MAARRILLPLLAMLLASCGFHLRGTATLPFETIGIALPDGNELRSQLKRAIETQTQARVAAADHAQVRLLILVDAPQKNILSLSSAGRVREFQLVRILSFRVVDAKNQEFIPTTTLRAVREITFDDTRVLAKESEEAQLWRDIQNDLVQQVIRRLTAAKLHPAD
jgi:LPS-assembly lipoprotein